MKEGLKIELLKQIITDKDILKELRKRKNLYVTDSIKNNQLELLIQKQNDGWEIAKKYKHVTRIRKKKSHDVKFEDSVWVLFALLGFNILNKDRYLKIPYNKRDPSLTQQIDVFAKDEESVIIVECKSAKKNTRGDFKETLEAYKGKIKGIKNAVKQLFPNSKPKFKFILATENYSISQSDIKRLDNINGIHFGEDKIKYYRELYGQIGLAARYQLLGSIFHGLEIPEMDNRIPAIKGKMGGHIYYSFSIEPEKLLKIGYILHRNKANINMMPTYQRIIKRHRLKSIHKFIENDKGYFPNSIIISINTNRALKFDRANTQVASSISDIGVLHLPKRYQSAFIIDGQHRLYGYANSNYKNTNSIPVVAFLNLERSEQVKLFMQINENQKAVSKNLRNTLVSDLLWTSDNKSDQLKALRSRVAIRLGEDRSSALFNKVTIGEDNKLIAMQTFHNALIKGNKFLGKVQKNKIEKLGVFYRGDLDDAFKKMLTFLMLTFDYLKNSIGEIWEQPGNIVVMNKGVFSFIMLQNDIIVFLLEKNIIKETDSPKKIFEETKTYLDSAINFILDIDNETLLGLKNAYGAGGDTKYWRTLQIKVKETHSDFNPIGLEEYIKKEEKEYNTEAFKFIRDIETFFKKDFKEKLQSKFGSNWLKKGVPPQIAKKANELAFEKNLKIEDAEKEVELWDCLTIIAYRGIALKNWRELFELDYTRPDEKKISGGKDAKTKWMVKLERLRNQNVHSYYVTEDEYSFLKDLHNWLISEQ